LTVKPALIEANSLKSPRIPAMVETASLKTWISHGFITLSSRMKVSNNPVNNGKLPEMVVSDMALPV
jgi:hypothetical protein